MGTVFTSSEWYCHECNGTFSWAHYLEKPEEFGSYDVRATVVERRGSVVKLQMKCPHCGSTNEYITAE
ncbi:MULTISPECIES: hypothetical protein [Brevibacillus]|uniref:hypothetical protein n=1 Tax=Brevibacillus TaxID=55080 RepID=UPI00165D307A|nr:hypothetical protein [Brevibacillus brevis]